ncbi:uncharacterized protein BXZ73DRAFT_9825, partial [Epithele typhae]|uniref:uncharacterized protein n=1 Tax=Epithele typhae TaxID=378194 RepID=UPI00200752AC
LQRDEDIDMSYEGLLSLSSILGDVKPRGTASDVISALPKGTYGDWAKPGDTEERCPICLDDYQVADPCLRVPDCTHWFHEGCLTVRLSSSPLDPVADAITSAMAQEFAHLPRVPRPRH